MGPTKRVQGVKVETVPSKAPPPAEAGSDFTAFFRDQFAAIALIAGTTAGDRSIGEDIAQVAFSRAHDRWDKVAKLDKPGAWVRRVAINLAISKRRRIGREASALRRLGPRQSVTLTNDARPYSDVWDAVGKLPARQRAVTVLHYHEGHSVAEIADLLDCSVSAATSNLHKARTRLAELLDSDQMGAPS